MYLQSTFAHFLRDQALILVISLGMHRKQPAARMLTVGFTDISGEVMTEILPTACLKATAKTLHDACALLGLRFLTQALSMRPES